MLGFVFDPDCLAMEPPSLTSPWSMLQTVKGVTLNLKVLNVPFPLSFHSLAQLLYCILRNQALALGGWHLILQTL